MPNVSIPEDIQTNDFNRILRRSTRPAARHTWTALIARSRGIDNRQQQNPPSHPKTHIALIIGTMMKTAAAILLSILGSSLAAPAVVWKNGEKQTEGSLRTSNGLKASDLLVDVLSVDQEGSSLASVIFVLGRGHDGSESLSALAAAGDLPNVEEKYTGADAIHHHVTGIESPLSLEKDVIRAGSEQKVLSINLSELSSRLESPADPTEVEVSLSGLMSKTQKYSHKRAKDLSDATVLVVTVDPRAEKSKLDNAIVSAIEDKTISSVVLTAVRSHDEVKQERLMEHNRRLTMMKNSGGKVHGRRLEDQQEEEEEENNNQNNNQKGDDNMTGVYYVSMTPNILAGILFMLLFAGIAFIGVTCMGRISGQDVYVKKMPPVGREA